MAKKAIRDRVFFGILSAFTVVMLALTVVGLVVFNIQVNNYEASGIDAYTTYSRIYAYIPNNPDSTVSENLYQALRDYGIQNDCLVERIGEDLATSYSKDELIAIAIRSKVSGIILEGDDSEETAALISQAGAADIPVVTVMTDAPGTGRCSFIGLNNYSVGVKYSDLILDAAEDREDASDLNALVIMSSGASNESVIYGAIQEQLQGSSVQIESVSIDSDSAFSTEEKVIDLLDEYTEMPDIIVCLSDITTRCVYQSVVDKNGVGVTTIIGYYGSDTVLEGIERGAIEATLSVDTNQVAQYCVDALDEFIVRGNVSEYYSTGYVLIDEYNVSGYMQETSVEGGV